MKHPPRRYSLVVSLFWIVGSTIIVAGLGFASQKHLQLEKKRAAVDPRQRIVKIVQTGPEKEALSTLYLAELLELSIDHPISNRAIDLQAAEAKLLRSPVIESAKVSLDKPNTIVIDYVARRPVAWLYDYVNIGIDSHAVPFPVHPFFSSKNLPEIVLGEPVALVWNHPILHKNMQLALTILNLLKPAPFTIKRIDVGQAYEENYGKRQIVVIIEETFKISWKEQDLLCVLPRILRLSTKDFRKELGNYLVLRDDETLAFDPTVAKFDADGKAAHLPSQVIDLRVAGMAFLQ